MEGVGIKSKVRVKKYGEVFTPDSIVCDMLDEVMKKLYSRECYNDDKFILETFLEPTCGDGQFLVRILDEKIKAVNRVPLDGRPLALVKAITTIYGIDIQYDNVLESRERLKNYLFNDDVDTFTFKQDLNVKTGELVDREFTKIDLDINPELKECLSNIIDNNIIVGNMLDEEEMKIIDYIWVGDTAYCKVVSLHLEDYVQSSLVEDEAGDFNIKEDKEYKFKFTEIQHIKTGSKYEVEVEKKLKEEAEKAEKEARKQAEKERKEAEKAAKKAKKKEQEEAEAARQALEDANPLDDKDF